MSKMCFIPILFFAIVLVDGFFSSGELTTMNGKLTYEKGNGIFLITECNHKKVSLSFVYDSENKLVIDDFEQVSVTGRYYKNLNALRVEEINGT